MLKPVILLDVDGVLADFMGHILAKYHILEEDIKLPKPWIYDVAYWIEHTKEYPKTTDHWEEDGWFNLSVEKSAKEQDFWVNIPKYPWANDFMSFLKSTKFEIVFVTKPMPHAEFFAGRFTWLRKNFPGIKLVITGEKHLLAKPNHLLIDDHEEICNKFTDHGGHSCLFPQHWNNRHRKTGFMPYIMEDVIKKLHEMETMYKD